MTNLDKSESEIMVSIYFSSFTSPLQSWSLITKKLQGISILFAISSMNYIVLVFTILNDFCFQRYEQPHEAISDQIRTKFSEHKEIS